MTFELKLSDGSVAEMEAEDGIEAARRYVDLHRDATVVAIRQKPWGVFIMGRRTRIIE